MTITTKVLLSFNGTNGKYPASTLIVDALGDLFGTTQYGGAGQAGTVFELVATSAGYAGSPTTLVAFDGTSLDAGDGLLPAGSLYVDNSGGLFGITEGTGPDFTSTVFEVARDATTATGYASIPDSLVNLNVADSFPFRGLITDADGDLFGTTLHGDGNGYDNSSGDGTVFEIKKTSTGYASTPTILTSFSGIDGDGPSGSLFADANGDLFGTTYSGGAYAHFDDGRDMFGMPSYQTDERGLAKLG